MPETVPGERPYTSAPLSFGLCPLPLPANLSVLLTLPCPGALPLPSPWPDLPISHPAYAPAATSPARYRAGRAKQHNPARNVKPLPPRRSPGRTLPGQEGVKGDTCLSPSPFSLPFGKKRKKPRPSMLCSLNKHRLLHLLYPCLSFLLYPYPKFLTSPRTCSIPILGFSFPPAFALALSPYPSPPNKKEPAGSFSVSLVLSSAATLPPCRRMQPSALSPCRQAPLPYAPNTSRAIATDACTSAA